MFPSVLEESPLEEETRTFCSLVEAAVLDPSPKVREIFQFHIVDRYPSVKRLFARDGKIYAAIRNDGHIYAVPVMPIPQAYLGGRASPQDVDLARLLQ